MKNIYRKPVIEELVSMQDEELLAGSGVSSSDISYGGVDVEGTKEAASRVIHIDALFSE